VKKNLIGIAAMVALIGTPALAADMPLKAPSSDQASDSQQQSKPSAEDPDYNGEDFTRPQQSVDTRLLYQTSGTTSQTDRETLLLRANWKRQVDNGWRLGLFGQVPVVDKTTFAPAGVDREFGIGDAAFQAALSHDIDRHWAFGFGARLVAPTGEDSLGSGKWQIMPGFGVRYLFPEPDTYFVPVVRYAISFAGDPSRRNISEPQIAPTLNMGLPDRWFVTFYPSNDIRINFGDPISGQTGRLFLPFDAAIGREMKNNWVISLEAAAPIIKDYPVYNFKAGLRIVRRF
jgi:hypothetical protein